MVIHNDISECLGNIQSCQQNAFAHDKNSATLHTQAIGDTL